MVLKTASRHRLWLVVAVLVGLAARVSVMVTTVYFYDEDRDWIPLAASISVQPGSVHLPIRGEFHPAVPAYGIAAGRALLGQDELGSRTVGVLVGTLSILILAAMAGRLAGPRASVITAWLVALNEYHVQVSALATEKAYYLFFASLALYLGLRFVRDDGPWTIYAAAVAMALALLSKELALFMVPALGVGLLVDRPEAFRSRHTWAAFGLGILLAAPDALWNLVPHTQQADYATHLGRLAGVGISPQPAAFYLWEPVKWVTGALGSPLHVTAGEYHAMNALFGITLCAGVALSLIRASQPLRGRALLVAVFLITVGSLSIINTRELGPGLDAQQFYWSDLSLLPAAVLTGVWLAGQSRPAFTGRVVVAAASVWSAWAIGGQRLGMPQERAVLEPEILSPVDATLRDVRIRHRVCMVCSDMGTREILGIDIIEAGRARTVPDNDPDALFPTDTSRRLQLRASIMPDDSLRTYVVRGRTLLPGGGERGWGARAYVTRDVRRYHPLPVW